MYTYINDIGTYAIMQNFVKCFTSIQLAVIYLRYSLDPLFVKYLTDSLTVNNACVQLLFFLKPMELYA